MILRVKDNLIMRTLVSSDAKEVFTVIDENRQYLREYLPWVDNTQSYKDTEKVIGEWQTDLENKYDYVFGIYLENKYIGNIGLHDINPHNNRGMIGYWLAEKYQGNGIITACVKSLTNFGIYELDLNRIYILCAVGNKKSRAVPERLGYIQEGIMQEAECLYGVYHDLVIYGVVRKNW